MKNKQQIERLKKAIERLDKAKEQLQHQVEVLENPKLSGYSLKEKALCKYAIDTKIKASNCQSCKGNKIKCTNKNVDEVIALTMSTKKCSLQPNFCKYYET